MDISVRIAPSVVLTVVIVLIVVHVARRRDAAICGVATAVLRAQQPPPDVSPGSETAMTTRPPGFGEGGPDAAKNGIHGVNGHPDENVQPPWLGRDRPVSRPGRGPLAVMSAAATCR